jgi:hypothetical protein
MAVWYCIPSIRPVDEASACFAEWQRQGYKTAAYLNPGAPVPENLDVVFVGEYRGYSFAVNTLAKLVLTSHHEANVIVTGGDDLFPDKMKRAAEIEAEFIAHFSGTLGVMQPSGDSHDRLIYSTCAVSPWMGREWCERANQGKGPLHEALVHYWTDRYLYEVAKKLGLLWLRPDLSQEHRHWLTLGIERPEHLKKWAARNQQDYIYYKKQEDAGFPGSELLP